MNLPIGSGPSVRRLSRGAVISYGERKIMVGGGAPVVVQSMTNTDTADAIGTAIQVKDLARAGSELVRITVNNPEAAAAVPAIREQLDKMGIDVPLVGDFHYNGHTLLNDYPECAKALAKYRINPGNVGKGAKRAESLGLKSDMIVISAKVSGVQDLISVYGNLASRCSYPLHLGLTEAGMGSKGIVASTAAMSVLLQEGIGDTIRVSLTPEPNGDRTQEVIVAQEILQTMGLRAFTPMVIACPGCGRTTSTYFQELAQKIQSHIRHRMPEWRKQREGVADMTVAVMGCVVNGPGESKHANIGISLPGTGEHPVAPVYEDGAKTVTLKGDRIAEEFQELVERYIERTYARIAT